MTSTPLISIIIPTYNYADRLSRAVNSVLQQLTEQHELIVIDDGSTDNTQAVLTDLQKNNSNFRAVHKDNAGPASARNRGIVEAHAEYLMFLDADDELDAHALSHIEQHIQKNPSSKMIIGGYISIRPNNAKRKVSLPTPLPDDRLACVKSYLIDKTISLVNGATVIHRSVFEKGLYPEHFRNSEDLPVFAQALGNYECSILKQPLALIYKHQGSLRYNVSYDQDVGMALVEEIFNTNRLPAQFSVLKNKFIAQRALSLFRGYYVAGLRKEAKAMYLMALKTDFKSIVKWSYTRKAIRLFLM